MWLEEEEEDLPFISPFFSSPCYYVRPKVGFFEPLGSDVVRLNRGPKKKTENPGEFGRLREKNSQGRCGKCKYRTL